MLGLVEQAGEHSGIDEDEAVEFALREVRIVRTLKLIRDQLRLRGCSDATCAEAERLFEELHETVGIDEAMRPALASAG